MLVIRLARGGAKKRPFYQVVVADGRMRLKGRYIERIGYYNPIAKGGETKFQINRDRLEHWIQQGAQLSQRVAQLVKSAPAQKAEDKAA